MGWVNDLKGKTVGLDTAPLIYLIEQHPAFLPNIEPFFEAVDRADIHLVTTTITLIEVLVHPLRKGDETLAQRYNDILLTSPNLTAVPISVSIAQLAAELRAQHGLKTPDAIQIAASIQHGAAAFLTNDRDLSSIHEISVLNVGDLAPDP